MDYNNINKLIEKYFDGLTTLNEEKILQDYFTSTEILPEHKSLKALFVFYRKQQNVTNPSPVRFKRNRAKRNYKLAIAASLIIGLGLFSVLNTEKTKVVASKEQPVKNKQMYKEMKKYTHNMNEGLKKVSALSIFGKSTRKVFNVNKKDTINTHKK